MLGRIAGPRPLLVQTTEKKKDIGKRDQAAAQETRELPKTPKTRGGFPARDESPRPPTVTAHLWANLIEIWRRRGGFRNVYLRAGWQRQF